MEFDFGWKGLLNPGESSCFFDVHAGHPFEVDATNYSVINAWWLAECSRVIYRRENDETGNSDHAGRRKEVFAEANLQETAFWQTSLGTQCAILESSADSVERFAVLVFRGSQGLKDWNTNFRFLKKGWKGSGRVHAGFHRALEPIWEEILKKLTTLECPFFYTGHSLGAALATLAAALHTPRALYTFGSPRVGDSEFVAAFEDVPAFRIVNNRDVVSTVPQSFLGYRHVGEQHRFGRDGICLVNPESPELKLLKQSRYQASDPKRKLTNPPELMFDHAPVNYVVHLERVVSAGM